MFWQTFSIRNVTGNKIAAFRPIRLQTRGESIQTHITLMFFSIKFEEAGSVFVVQIESVGV